MKFSTRRVIDRNLTIYCAPTGGDGDFIGDQSFTQSLKSLDPYDITANVTLQFADGVYGLDTALSQFIFTNPNISRVVVQGQNQDAMAFDLSESDYAPDPNSHSVYIKNTTGALTPGDFFPGGDYRPFIFSIVNSTGNDGAHKILGATAINNHIRLVTDGSILDATQDGTLYFLPSNRCQFVFAPDSTGFSFNTMGVLQLNGLFLYGQGTSTFRRACYSNANGVSFHVSRCVFSNWSGITEVSNGAVFRYLIWPNYANANVGIFDQYGLSALSGGSVEGTFAVFSGGQWGFVVGPGGTLVATRSVASRCGIGYRANGGSLSVTYSRACHNYIGYHPMAGIIQRDQNYCFGNDSDYLPMVTTLPVQNTIGGVIY